MLIPVIDGDEGFTNISQLFQQVSCRWRWPETERSTPDNQISTKMLPMGEIINILIWSALLDYFKKNPTISFYICNRSLVFKRSVT